MNMKKKSVIFGAGERGTRIYKKLINFFEVIAYSDNNKDLWGSCLNGVPIISPNDLPEVIHKTNAIIFIANELHYLDIAKQLDDLGMSYYNCENYMCYELVNGIWYPVSFGKPEAYKKPEKSKFAVLFVQDKPCTRTNKIAEVLKHKGVLTYAAYTAAPSDVGNKAYVNEFPFWTYNELLDFVNESAFDIVHCSNEPDILINLLIYSNKKVVHDCHDIVTMSKAFTYASEGILEHIANTQADGVIYVTEHMREVLQRKYVREPAKTLVLGNYALSSFGKIERLPKLSEKDGKIHCVYEGHIIDHTNVRAVAYRFLEPIFKQLSALDIHVHIYSHSVPEYLKQLDYDNPNIHYEGNYNGQALITEMTRYDLGLLIFPLINNPYFYLSFPNKLPEYLSAGLPVVTNFKAFADIVTAGNCGGPLDLDKDDVVSKLEEYRKISISDDFCDTHGLTMEANVDKIMAFYKDVINQS